MRPRSERLRPKRIDEPTSPGGWSGRSEAARLAQASSWLRLPRIEDRRARILEVRDVAGHEDEVMDDGGGRDQAVDVSAGPDGGDPTPFDRDLVCHRKDAVGVVMAQLAQPFGK